MISTLTWPPTVPASPPAARATPLRTAGNQIVDSYSRVVRLAGVNWFGLETPAFAPHGLDLRDCRSMLLQMRQLGFNTVRLPFCSQLLSPSSKPGNINYRLNPDFGGLGGLGVIDRIVYHAGEVGLRIILDHHRSRAGGGPNENGLWYADEWTHQRWLANWVMLAERYAGNATVVGADLHNEPHGPATWGGGDRATDWPLAAEQAGNAILAVNPDWLIFVEGVDKGPAGHYWWGGELSAARQRPVRLNVANRLVYSPHDYPGSVYPQPWFAERPYPDNLRPLWDRHWGYLFRENIAPVFLGEFGSRLQTASDRKWLAELVGYLNGGIRGLPAGKQGIGWSWWSWNPDSSDTGGMLQDDWASICQDKYLMVAPILEKQGHSLVTDI